MKRKAFKPSLIIVYALLIFWALVIIFPVYWVIISSFKLPIAVMQGATYIPFVDFDPSLRNYEHLFTVGLKESKIGLHFLNSAIASIGGAVVAVSLGSLAAYGLSRFMYKIGPINNNVIMFLIMGLRMLPPVSLVFAFLLMFQATKLVDTLFGLILVYATFNLPLAVWILRDAFNEIPRELDESALIDGGSWFTSFWNIVLPLAFGSIAATFLMCFIFNWNEYLFALVLTYIKSGTVPLLLAQSSTSRGMDWGRMSALTVISILPSIAAGIFLEKYLRKGILAGAIKG